MGCQGLAHTEGTFWWAGIGVTGAVCDLPGGEGGGYLQIAIYISRTHVEEESVYFGQDFFLRHHN